MKRTFSSLLPRGLAQLVSTRPLNVRKVVRGLRLGIWNRLYRAVPPRLRFLYGDSANETVGRAVKRRADPSPYLGGVEHLTLVLTGHPFAFSGGGLRPAQLALALLRRGHAVIFVNKWLWKEDLSPQGLARMPLLWRENLDSPALARMPLFTYSLRTFDVTASSVAIPHSKRSQSRRWCTSRYRSTDGSASRSDSTEEGLPTTVWTFGKAHSSQGRGTPQTSSACSSRRARCL